MSLIKKLAGETAIYGIPSILSRVLNFAIIGAYYSRILSKPTYNDWQQMYVLAAIGLVIFTYRMETTLFRFGSKADSKDTAFTTAMSIIVISTLILVPLMYLASSGLHQIFLQGEGPVRFIYYFIGIIALDALAAIPFAKLRLDNQAARFAKLKVANIIVNIVLVLVFLEVIPPIIDIELDEVLKLDLIFMANLITSLVILIFVVPVFGSIKSRWTFDKKMGKQMFVYTWPLAVIALAGVFNQYGQFPLLQSILPDDGAKDIGGTYAAATKLAVFMTLFTTAFNYAAEPFFFKQASGKKDPSVYGKVAAAYTLVAVFVFLGVTYYIDIISMILGRDFRSGVGVVPIVMLAYLLLGLYYNVAIWYKLSDNTRYGMMISILGVIITISLNILLIPHFDYYGCAWATLGCYATMLAVCYWYGQRIYPIDYPIGRIIGYIGLAVIFWQVSNYVRLQFEGHIIVILGINTSLLASFAILIFSIDRTYLKSLLR